MRQSDDPPRRESLHLAFDATTLHHIINNRYKLHDVAFLPLSPRQLNDRITGDLKSKLLDVCDNDVECDLINLDPVCEDDLSSSKSLDGDSRSRRRRRRDRSRYARDDGMASPIERASESSLEYPGRDDATRLKRRRDRIEIKFRFIGKNAESLAAARDPPRRDSS